MDNGGPFSSMKWLGRVAPRSSLDVQGSRLSVGFETLDRAMFDPEPIYPHLAALGVKWARLQTGWGRTERERGVYDFDWLDSVVDALLGIGIQPFFNVGYGNQLYVPEAPAADALRPQLAPRRGSPSRRGTRATGSTRRGRSI